VTAAANHTRETELVTAPACGPAGSIGRQACREHAAFSRAPEVEPLLHCSRAGASELHQPACQRAGNAERIAHAGAVKFQEAPAGRGGAEWPGRARAMEAATLVPVPGRAANADHHPGTGDHRGHEL